MNKGKQVSKETMNKGELISRVAKQAKVTKERAKTIISETLNVIRTEVKKGVRVGLVGFGTFEKVQRKAKQGRNPHTGEPVKIPARKLPRFRPGMTFKKLVNGK
jgi:DNA-binding protein HU-beta